MLLVVSLARFIVVLDTIVNVALPLGPARAGLLSIADLQWMINAYLLLFGGFLLLGRQRLFSSAS